MEKPSTAISSASIETTASVYGAPSRPQDEWMHTAPLRSLETLKRNEVYNRDLQKSKVVNIVGMVMLVVVGGIELCLGVTFNIVSLSAMGAEMMVDVVSSAIVFWRFKGVNFDPTTQGPIFELKAAKKEQRATQLVGWLFVVISIWVAIWSSFKLWDNIIPTSLEIEFAAVLMMSIAWPNVFVFSVLAYAKYVYARKLQSNVIMKDCICTAFGVALSFIAALFVTIDYALIAQEKHSQSNAADSVASMAMAVLICFEGVRTIIGNSSRWKAPEGTTRNLEAQNLEGEQP